MRGVSKSILFSAQRVVIHLCKLSARLQPDSFGRTTAVVLSFIVETIGGRFDLIRLYVADETERLSLAG